MNQSVRTPSFTVRQEGPSPVAKVAASHPVSTNKVPRPILHLPPAKQGVARRNWPFLNSLDALDSLTLLNR